MHFFDWLDFHASARPADTAIVTPRVTLTYGQIRPISLSLAARLHGLGVRRGQQVALFALNPALQIALIAALNRLGAAVCILPREVPRRKAGLEALAFDWYLTDAQEESGAKQIPIALDWLNANEPTTGIDVSGFASPGDICLIMMSSGTTSAPKPIGYTVRQMEYRIMWRGFGEQATIPGERTALLQGLASMMGFHIAFGTLWGGGTIYMGWDAKNVVALIAGERIHRLFASPPLMQQTMDAFEQKPANVSSLRLVYLGGDSIPTTLARRITQSFCANLLGGFGMNETGQIAAVSVARSNFKIEQVGFLYPWAEAQAVDDEDDVLPRGTEGRLRFRSKSTSDGYLENPEATAAQFKDGWFYSGDSGWVTQDRMLVFSGRRTETIKTKSAKIAPHKIDQMVAGYPGIKEAAAFGVAGADDTDEIWLAVVSDRTLDMAALRDFCGEKMGAYAPAHFMQIDKLPRNEGGKILRWALMDMAREHSG